MPEDYPDVSEELISELEKLGLIAQHALYILTAPEELLDLDLRVMGMGTESGEEFSECDPNEAFWRKLIGSMEELTPGLVERIRNGG